MANAFLGWLHKKVVAPVENAASDVGHAIAAPIEHVAAPVVNAVEHPMGVIAPVAHDINNDIAKPIERAPQNFINDVSDPVSNYASKSAFGRGLTDVGLGAYRAASRSRPSRRRFRKSSRPA